ncbi:copper amine oxidase N-terminal domain-containing protein [Paenibacillus agaridevorans]|uniref:copper amine oxidase N-terminal domain-containing protein n=1 Tax=Paenibacillus agaridevorans TaxID=171404 RepID=UPI001FE4AC59|nr:copper amine oxidase N-terminal domain-containing protein [Paenibacillus agaridevorans]
MSVLKKKAFAAIIGVSMLASMGTGAFAATKLQEIKAFLNPEIKVQVDGTYADLRDVNGNAIAPIVYQGANYFPIRAVSDALDVAVDYDEATKTIILGEKVEGTSIAKGFDDMYHTKDPVQTTYKGKDYKEAFYDNASGNRNVSFMLYPDKNYQTLYLQIAAVGGDLTDFTIKDSENDIILKTENVIKSENGLVTVKVDIGGVEELYIYGSANKDTTVFIPLTTSYYK